MMCHAVVVGLGAVVGIDVGDALAEPGAVAVERHQDERLVVDAAEAGLEEARRAAGAAAAARRRSMRTRHAIATPATGSRYSRLLYSLDVDFRYIAIEGPLGVGKSALADRLGARLDATIVLDETDNPFLADFYAGRAGRRVPGAAVLHARAPPAADRAAPERSLQPAHGLRLPLRARQDLRLPESRRQRAVHLPAALRAAGAGRAVAGSRHLPADADRRAAPPAAASARAPTPTRRRSTTTTSAS